MEHAHGNTNGAGNGAAAYRKTLSTNIEYR